MNIKLIYLSLSLIISIKAVAAREPGESNDFSRKTRLFSESCVFEVCEKPLQKKSVYRHSDQGSLNEDYKKIFLRIAESQAQIWGDTILEGDYVAHGPTRLDRVYELYLKDEFIGYQITYSEKAWNIADCRYDGLRDSTLIGCLPGRIVESSYVTPDFKDYFYDEKTSAVFK